MVSHTKHQFCPLGFCLVLVGLEAVLGLKTSPAAPAPLPGAPPPPPPHPSPCPPLITIQREQPQEAYRS